MARYLVVGLGNPGPRHAATRHNVGFRLVDVLAGRWGVALRHGDELAAWGEGRVADEVVVLAKPVTFMNASGQAVLALRESVRPDGIIIGFDDLDLPLGRVRLRGGGGAGGHRGVTSVIEAVGPEFVRVRIGIGRPTTPETIDFVLAPFAPEEQAVVEDALARAADGVACLLREGLEAAMRLCNGPVPLAIERPIR